MKHHVPVLLALTALALVADAGCGGKSLLLTPGDDLGDPGGRIDGGIVVRRTDSGFLDTGIRTGPFDTGVFDTGAFDTRSFDVEPPFEASVDAPMPPLDTGIDTSLPGDAGPFPAAFTAPPQVVNLMGPVLSSPKIVAIMFTNDDATEVPDIEAFFNGIGSTKYWAGLEEYGVGPATAQVVTLMQASPGSIDDTAQQGQMSQLQTWLLGQISAQTIPAPDANTEYMIVFPSSTTITEDGTTLCSSGVGGYHADFQDGQTLVSYGVLPRCPAMQGLTELQLFTAASSHEIFEAATDPYPNFNPAWAQCDDAHIFWDEADSGSEIGDMCENQPSAFFQFSDFPYVVQRYWSNAAARAGSDPCVPEYPQEVFFNSVPELPDTVTFPQVGDSIVVSTKKIAVGASDTVTLDLYSEAATGPWTVTVLDFNYLQTGNASSALLNFSMPQTTGQNGSRLPVTITVNTAGNTNTNGQINNSELFLIESSQGTGSAQTVNLWWGLVSN